MSTNDKDHDTWVYHALHEAKVVKASEAEKLYKQGWRDSPDPKILLSGIRGNWYKLVITYRSFMQRIAPHWDSYKIVVVILSIVGIIIAIAKIY